MPAAAAGALHVDAADIVVAVILLLLIAADLTFVLGSLWRRRASVRLPVASKEPGERDEKQRRALIEQLSREARVSLNLISVRTAPSLTTDQRRLQINVRRLQGLLDQIVELSVSGGRGLEPRVHASDLAVLVGRAIDILQPYAARADVHLDRSGVPADLSWQIDAEIVERALAHVLINAIRYSPAGATVAIALHARDVDAVEVVVEERAAASAELGHDGAPLEIRAGHARPSFLGLALARRLIAALGGSLSWQERAGRCCVRLRLPRLEPSPGAMEEHGGVVGSIVEQDADAALGRADSPIERLARLPRLLVIDDRADVRSGLGAALADAFEVQVSFRSGPIGVFVGRVEPDIVLVDLVTWLAGGRELLQEIRAEPAAACVPVVAMLDSDSPELRAQALSEGADECCSRPVDVDLLRSRLLALVDERRRLGRAPRTETGVAGRSEARRRAFLERVRQVIGERLHDEEFSVEQLADLVHTSRYQLFRKIKRATGLSPQGLISEARLERADQLLREGRGTVSEIAFAAGYGSLAHFSRTFRRRFGIAPSTLLGRGSARHSS